MDAVRKLRTFTFDEYLAIERNAGCKSDYVLGSIYAMAGGTRAHARIASNLLASLSYQLRGSGCWAVGSDLLVTTENRDFSAYPDVTVCCDPPIHLDETEDVLLNPRVIAEVLSPSTEAYDRGEKFRNYQRIRSLEQYLLLSQDEPRIELWIRRESGWVRASAHGLDADAHLPSISVTVRLSEVYEGIDFS